MAHFIPQLRQKKRDSISIDSTRVRMRHDAHTPVSFSIDDAINYAQAVIRVVKFILMHVI